MTDPQLASYGSSNYGTRLPIGTNHFAFGHPYMELDKTFDIDDINRTVVAALDEAAVSWSVKVFTKSKDLVP